VEGVRVIAADDVAGAVDPEGDLAGAGVQLGQRPGEGVAGAVGERGRIVHIDSRAGDLVAVADPFTLEPTAGLVSGAKSKLVNV